MMTTETDWRPLAAALTEEISHEVSLSPEWREAFEQTPRHRFVPEVPLEAAYQDESIVIKTINDRGFDWPTSSSTKPSLMAYMLMMLRLEDDHTVLEIGTGSGYNAALLCDRLDAASVAAFDLGPKQVASIDLDPDLVAAAEQRLLSIGRGPDLIAGDGRKIAFPGRAFDRIIVTAGARRVPAAWAEQLNDGGMIVTDLGGRSQPRIIRLTKEADGRLLGKFRHRPGWFMPLRPDAGHPAEDPGNPNGALDLTGETRLTNPPVPPVFLDEAHTGLAFAVDFFLQPTMLVDQLRDGSPGVLITTEDGSWIEIDPNGNTTTAGPTSLAEPLEQITSEWKRLNEPEDADLRLIVTPDDAHTLYAHDFEHRWEEPQA
ncbi:hypothetical protein [Glycomyces buryatensis]|uniref:Protein-L-isoaspartate O-methyltransferase n=1 Tax=Glycomyces buryatensis TaxID=2570927 RepID=A0A4S8Q5Q1_9ACTN|nr:hypothetical protein [Glycomyces buryatensis]THV39478.1 hypothetical protein FAB82_17850 [Glycomyces buryatensis]